MRRLGLILAAVLTLALWAPAPASADSHWNLDGARACHGVTFHVNVGWFRYWYTPPTGPAVIRDAWNIRAWSSETGHPAFDYQGKMWINEHAGLVTDTGPKTSVDGNAGSNWTGDQKAGFGGSSYANASADPTIAMWAGADGDGYGMCLIEEFGLE